MDMGRQEEEEEAAACDRSLAFIYKLRSGYGRSQSSIRGLAT